MTAKGNVLYVNLIVRSVSEAVKKHVTKKLEKAKGIPNSMVAKAAVTAGELANPKYVTQALGDEICTRLPEEMKKKGIFSRMEFVFHENRYAVMELRIIYVNPLAMVSAFAEAGLSCFFCCIGASNRRYFEEEYLPEVLASTIATIIPQILGANLANKKIDAETKVNKACDQAAFFFSTLNKLRLEYDETKSRNPITRIRKRMSSQSSIGSGSRGSHRKAGSVSSFNMKRINSQGSLNSDRNSDEITVDTRGTNGSLSPGSKRSVIKTTTKKGAAKNGSTRSVASKASKASRASMASITASTKSETSKAAF
mmetsp:Transcript_7735/g.18954  ORF Transcript_7735/g.18954 Transcript_7735/m.18954 type:complete len:311 (+) Transcript_7735:125-1057(+)